MGKAVTRAAQLRAEAEALRAKLNDEISPMTRHRVQTLIDELEAEARSLDNGDARGTRHAASAVLSGRAPGLSQGRGFACGGSAALSKRNAFQGMERAKVELNDPIFVQPESNCQSTEMLMTS